MEPGNQPGDFGPRWVKSSLSFSNGNCVEVANLGGRVTGVRDSKNPAGGVLRFGNREWREFISKAKAGAAPGL